VKQQVGTSDSAASAAIVFAAQSAGNDYSRSEPWQAEVLANQVITGRGSSKQTRHLELSLEDSGMQYLVGDSIGILAPNPRELVEAIVAHQQLDPQAQVENPQGKSVALVDALVNDYEIAPLARPVLQRFCELTESPQIAELLEADKADQLSEWLYGRDLLDLLVEQPSLSLTAEQLVSLLRPQQPRLYSIASSPEANSDEVHLTLATVEFSARDRDRQGVTTGWIADTVKEGDQIGIYRHENPLFRLPEESDRPVIMIGPGTGVAPFRAFLDQREAESAEGNNWLFFGDRNFTTDFLYQREWQSHLASGLLTKIDLAFSRDQSERIYVQQRMLEQSQEFYRWLEEGAAVYVCGDAGRMASDVHDALLSIIQKEGGLSAESAADYVSLMQRERRYQRDVY
ncbi:MAG: NADPH-dependent assimilatory sulfite reductase flavoprotein subunit, partial [Immundisolibacteraceae bacterium]|nr:NADPH-dependent assimilatory sulfite reductase flavoprotein subunit [Immundisolibacteraceae bacterium]